MKKSFSIKQFCYEAAMIVFGCLLFAVGFDWFVAPNHFSIGGLTGVAQIINALLPNISVGVAIIVLNVPLFLLSWIFIGRQMLVRSLVAMVLSSVLIDAVAQLHDFQPMDPLLASIYGGVLLGVAFGVMLQVNTTTGGTELGARLLKIPMPHLPIGKLCMIIDVVVVVAYAAVFQNLLNAMYGIIALYISSLVIDYLIYGMRTAQVAYIISDKSAEITEKLLEMDRGVTLLEGRGAYNKQPRQVILCAMKRNMIVPVKLAVKEIDPDAFVIVCKANEVLGEGFGEYTKDSL